MTASSEITGPGEWAFTFPSIVDDEGRAVRCRLTLPVQVDDDDVRAMLSEGLRAMAERYGLDVPETLPKFTGQRVHSA